MNAKQQWLLKHLLIPAGILPPGINYEHLKYNAQNRQQIGNLGFEYMFLLNQNANELNSSKIGGKIMAMHAPFSEFGASLAGKFELTKKIATKLLYGDNKITDDFFKMADISCSFAQKIGAKTVTFHIGQLDHMRLKDSLAHLLALSRQHKVQTTIEYEGPYIFDQIKNGTKLSKFEGSYDWLIDPVKMLRGVDSLLPKNNLSITFDTASLIACEIPIAPTLAKVRGRIGHVHLAGSAIGKDTAAEIDRQDIVDVVSSLYDTKYASYITAEIAGTQGLFENLLATVFGLSAFADLRLFEKTCVHNAQSHIQNSCNYLLKNL